MIKWSTIDWADREWLIVHQYTAGIFYFLQYYFQMLTGLSVDTSTLLTEFKTYEWWRIYPLLKELTKKRAQMEYCEIFVCIGFYTEDSKWVDKKENLTELMPLRIFKHSPEA
jgi:hypothetical protein